MNTLTLNSYHDLSTSSLEHQDHVVEHSNGKLSLVEGDSLKEQDKKEVVEHFKQALIEEYGTKVAKMVFNNEREKDALSKGLSARLIQEVIQAANKEDVKDESTAAAYAKCARMNAMMAKEVAVEAKKEAQKADALLEETRKKAATSASIDLVTLIQQCRHAQQAAEEAVTYSKEAAEEAAKADQLHLQAADKKETSMLSQLKGFSDAVSALLQKAHRAFGVTSKMVASMQECFNAVPAHEDKKMSDTSRREVVSVDVDLDGWATKMANREKEGWGKGLGKNPNTASPLVHVTSDDNHHHSDDAVMNPLTATKTPQDILKEFTTFNSVKRHMPISTPQQLTAEELERQERELFGEKVAKPTSKKVTNHTASTAHNPLQPERLVESPADQSHLERNAKKQLPPSDVPVVNTSGYTKLTDDSTEDTSHEKPKEKKIQENRIASSGDEVLEEGFNPLQQ